MAWAWSCTTTKVNHGWPRPCLAAEAVVAYKHARPFFGIRFSVQARVGSLWVGSLAWKEMNCYDRMGAASGMRVVAFAHADVC